jgi:hypothetical protein
MSCQTAEQRPDLEQGVARRKPYHKPIVVRLGNLRDVTLGMNGSAYDVGQQTPAKRGHG